MRDLRFMRTLGRLAATFVFAVPAITIARPLAHRESHRAAVPADCVAAHDRFGAARLLYSIPGSGDEAKAERSLGPVLLGCKVALSTPAQREQLRGNLAENLWLRSVSEFGGTLSDVKPDMPNYGSGFPNEPNFPQIYSFVTCVVRSHGSDVDTLIRTAPGSEAENNAIASLSTSFAPCLDRGATVNLPKPRLRALLAQQMFRSYGGPFYDAPPDLRTAILREGEPGDQPALARFRELAEETAAKASKGYVTPRFRWDMTMAAGTVRLYNGRRFSGWWACGKMYDALGGRPRPFLVVIRSDKVIYSIVGNDLNIDLAYSACRDARAAHLY